MHSHAHILTRTPLPEIHDVSQVTSHSGDDVDADFAHTRIRAHTHACLHTHARTHTPGLHVVFQVTSHSGDDVDADLLLIERRLLAKAGGDPEVRVFVTLYACVCTHACVSTCACVFMFMHV